MDEYSLSQMDDFYRALAVGRVKTSGIMNYIQHLMIASECKAGDCVLDLCCGRALLIPLLRERAPHIASYLGVDISERNLSEASVTIRDRTTGPNAFSCTLLRADVCALPLSSKAFDVIAYTSSIEHLPRDAGIRSLEELHSVLAPDGVLFVSTPNTLGARSGRRQYKVHVHEWEYDDLAQVLESTGFEVTECVGLLAPSNETMTTVLSAKFGQAAVDLWRALERTVPHEFLEPVIASVTATSAREVFLRCHHRGFHGRRQTSQY